MKFKGNTRELLIGQWKAIEKAGGRPTINAVLRAARECYGATFPNIEGFAILKPFAAKAFASRRTFRAQTENLAIDTTKERRTRGELAENSRRTFPEQTENSRRGNGEAANSIRERVRPNPVPFPNDVARARENDATKVERNDDGANGAANDLATAAFAATAGKTEEQRQANRARLAAMFAPRRTGT